MKIRIIFLITTFFFLQVNPAFSNVFDYCDKEEIRLMKKATFTWAEIKQMCSNAGYSSAYSKSNTPSLNYSAIGEWYWFNGGVVTLTNTGIILSNGKNAGTYSCSGNTCKLRWEKGYIDTLTISANAKKLDGKNQHGTHVWGNKKRGYTSHSVPMLSAIGAWYWFNGGVVRLTSDGKIISSGKNAGTYSCSGNTCKLRWGKGYIDTLTISADGRKLDGKNQNGTHVWAKRK